MYYPKLTKLSYHSFFFSYQVFVNIDFFLLLNLQYVFHIKKKVALIDDIRPQNGCFYLLNYN